MCGPTCCRGRICQFPSVDWVFVLHILLWSPQLPDSGPRHERRGATQQVFKQLSEADFLFGSIYRSVVGVGKRTQVFSQPIVKSRSQLFRRSRIGGNPTLSEAAVTSSPKETSKTVDPEIPTTDKDEFKFSVSNQKSTKIFFRWDNEQNWVVKFYGAGNFNVAETAQKVMRDNMIHVLVDGETL